MKQIWPPSSVITEINADTATATTYIHHQALSSFIIYNDNPLSISINTIIQLQKL
jgi:hypothetical protein